MKKNCVECGREFEARGKEKLCPEECRTKRQLEHWRRYYSRNIEELRCRQRERYQQDKGGSGECEARRERQLALELAYWNYLIAKYPGGAKCK